ncbi:MAG: hypothetical protein ACLQUY_12440 [Ktedonobacterales bacterium]
MQDHEAFHPRCADTVRTVRFSQVYPDLLNPGVNELLSILESMTQEAAPDPAS